MLIGILLIIVENMGILANTNKLGVFGCCSCMLWWVKNSSCLLSLVLCLFIKLFFFYIRLSFLQFEVQKRIFIGICLDIPEFGEEKSILLDGLTEQQIDGKLRELVLH